MALRKEISQFKHIVVKPTPELEEKIAREIESVVRDVVKSETPGIYDDFRSSTDESLRQVSHALGVALRDVYGAATNLDAIAQKVDCTTQLSQISNSVWSVKNHIDEMRREPESRARTLVDAALSEEDPKLRLSYLFAALQVANVKSKVVRLLLKEGMAMAEQCRIRDEHEQADEIFMSLQKSIETAKLNASAADIPELCLVEREIAESMNSNPILDERKAAAKDAYKAKIEELEDYASLMALRDGLLSDSLLDNEARDELDILLVNKMACATPADVPVLIPFAGADYNREKYAENVKLRLKNENVGVEERLADYLRVEKFISQEESEDALTNEFSGVVSLGKRLFAEHWKKRADAAIEELQEGSGNDSLQNIYEMLSQVESLPSELREPLRDSVIRLHRAVFRAGMLAIDDNIENAKGLQSHIGDDDMIQILAAQQAGCLNMMCDARRIERKYPDALQEEVAALAKKAEALSMLVSGYRERAIADAQKEQRESQKKQTERFVDWAKQCIASAEEEFSMAEKKAKKEILTTKKAPEVQDRYEKAWRKLMGIDPSDLEMANSALNKHRQQLIDKIENVLDEKRRNLKEIEYTRLLDF